MIFPANVDVGDFSLPRYQRVYQNSDLMDFNHPQWWLNQEIWWYGNIWATQKIFGWLWVCLNYTMAQLHRFQMALSLRRIQSLGKAFLSPQKLAVPMQHCKYCNIQSWGPSMKEYDCITIHHLSTSLVSACHGWILPTLGCFTSGSWSADLLVDPCCPTCSPGGIDVICEQFLGLHGVCLVEQHQSFKLQRRVIDRSCPCGWVQAAVMDHILDLFSKQLCEPQICWDCFWLGNPERIRNW